jgi:xanthine dehydrogenase YagR molybdenum-binding subunit
MAISPRHWGRDRHWLYLWQPKVKVEVAVKGGRIVASTATQDIGTGTRSVIANTVAREFDLEPSEVEVRIGDSSLPEGPGSGGSPRMSARGDGSRRRASGVTTRRSRADAGPAARIAMARADRALVRHRRVRDAGRDSKNTAPASARRA